MGSVQGFPVDVVEPPTEGTWWLVYFDGEPVGFAGMKPARTDRNAVYLSRSGVLPGHRGKGLQKRLIRARLAEAKRQGRTRAITTTFENPPSANNLIATGFRQYSPAEPWGPDGTAYWTRSIP